MSEGFVQVAPDSTGKKVGMEQVVLSDGTTAYLQKALIVGDAADALLAMNDTMKKQLAVLRALLFALTNGDVTEETYLE